PDLLHAIDSRPAWWIGAEPAIWSPASAADRGFAEGLVSSLVISLAVSRSTRWSHAGGQSGLSGVGWHEFGDEVFDSAPDLVSDWPYGVDSSAGWVFEYPVFVAFAGVEGAGVAASHGDHDVG